MQRERTRRPRVRLLAEASGDVLGPVVPAPAATAAALSPDQFVEAVKQVTLNAAGGQDGDGGWRRGGGGGRGRGGRGFGHRRGNCYRCGKPGHFAFECTVPLTTAAGVAVPVPAQLAQSEPTPVAEN